MFKRATSFLVTPLLALLLTVAAPLVAPAQNKACLPAFPAAVSAEKAGELIYPFGTQEKPGTHIQFGWESEYTLESSAKLLNFYSPKDIPTAEWDARTPEQKIAWVKAKLAKKPEYAADSGLILRPDLIAQNPEFSFLPKTLIQDSTGNLEIVLPPMETKAELQNRMRLANERFGAGSMQATFSMRRKDFFARSLEENLGWLNLTNEVDTVQKLLEGAARYSRDKTKFAARSFEHPWLGPMTRLKRDKLVEYLAANSTGKLLDKESLKFLKDDASFKFIGGLAYRPDVAVKVDRVAFEQRSAHTDEARLNEMIDRDVDALSLDRAPYTAFAQAPAFDTVKDFMALPASVRGLVAEIFPAKTDPRFTYSETERLSVEVFRNFAYPMRDWKAILTIMGPKTLHELGGKVSSAQVRYLEKLESVNKSWQIRQITRDQAAIQIQGALVEFVSESGIGQKLLQYQAKLQNDSRILTHAQALPRAG